MTAFDPSPLAFLLGSSAVAMGSGYAFASAAIKAGENVVLDVTPMDEQEHRALWLQIQANRRDPMCTGAY